MKSSNRIFVVISTMLILEASAHSPLPSLQSYSSHLLQPWNQQKTGLVDYTSPILTQQPLKTWGSSSIQTLPTGTEPKFGSTFGTNAFHQKPFQFSALPPLSTKNSQSSASSISSSQTGGLKIEDETKGNIIHIPIPAGTNRNEIFKLPISGLASNFKIVHLSPTALNKDSSISSDVVQSLEKVKADLTKIESKFEYDGIDNVGKPPIAQQNYSPVISSSNWKDLYKPAYGNLYDINNVPLPSYSDSKLPESLTSFGNHDTPKDAAFYPINYPHTTFGIAPNQHDFFNTAPIQSTGVNQKGNDDKKSAGSTIYSVNSSNYGLDAKNERPELPYKNNWPDFDKQSVGPGEDKTYPVYDWKKDLGNQGVFPDSNKPNSANNFNSNGKRNPEFIPNSDILYQSNFKYPYVIPHSDTLHPDLNKKLGSENLGITPSYDKFSTINNWKNYGNPDIVPHSNSLKQYGVPQGDVLYPDLDKKQDSIIPVTNPNVDKFSPTFGNDWKDNKNSEIIPDSSLLYPGSYSNGVYYPQINSNVTPLDYKQPQSIDKLNDSENQKVPPADDKPGSKDNWHYLSPTPATDTKITFIEPHHSIAHYLYEDGMPHFNSALKAQPISTRQPFNPEPTSKASNAQNMPKRYTDISDLFKRYPFLKGPADKLPTYGISPTDNLHAPLDGESNKIPKSVSDTLSDSYLLPLTSPKDPNSPPSYNPPHNLPTFYGIHEAPPNLDYKYSRGPQLTGPNKPNYLNERRYSGQFNNGYYPNLPYSDKLPGNNNPAPNTNYDKNTQPQIPNSQPKNSLIIDGFDRSKDPADDTVQSTSSPVHKSNAPINYELNSTPSPKSNSDSPQIGIHGAPSNLHPKYPYNSQLRNKDKSNYRHYFNRGHFPRQVNNGQYPHFPEHAQKLPLDRAIAPTDNPEVNKSQTTNLPNGDSNNQPKITNNQQDSKKSTLDDNSEPIDDGFDYNWVPRDDNVQSTPLPVDNSTAPVNNEPKTPSSSLDSSHLPIQPGIHKALLKPHYRYPYAPHGSNKPDYLNTYNRKNYPGQFHHSQYQHLPKYAHKFPVDVTPAREISEHQATDTPNDQTEASINKPQSHGQSTPDDNSESVYSPTNDGFDNNRTPRENIVQTIASPVEDTTASVNDAPNITASPEIDFYSPISPDDHHKYSHRPNNKPDYSGRYYPRYKDRQPYLLKHSNKLPTDKMSAHNVNNPENNQPQATDLPSNASNYQLETTSNPLGSGQKTQVDNSGSTDRPTNSGFDNIWASGEENVQSTSSPIEDSTVPVNEDPNNTAPSETDHYSPNQFISPNDRHNYSHRPNNRLYYSGRYYPRYKGRQPYLLKHSNKLPTEEISPPNGDNSQNNPPQTTDSPSDASNYQFKITSNPLGLGQKTRVDNSGSTHRPTNSGFDNIWSSGEENVQSTPSPIEDATVPVNEDPNSTAPPETDLYSPHQIFSPNDRHKYSHRQNNRPYYSGKHYPRHKGRQPYFLKHSNKFPIDEISDPNGNNPDNNEPPTTDLPSDVLNDQPEASNNPKDTGENSLIDKNSDDVWTPEESTQSTASPIEDSTAPVNDEHNRTAQSKSNSPTLPDLYHKYPHKSQLTGSNKPTHWPYYTRRHYPVRFYNRRNPYFSKPVDKWVTDESPATNINNSENTQPPTTVFPSNAGNEQFQTTDNPLSTENNNNDDDDDDDYFKPTDSTTNGGFDNSWAPGDDSVQLTTPPTEESAAPVNDKSKSTALPEFNSDISNVPSFHGIHDTPNNLQHKYPHRPNDRRYYYGRHYPGQYYNGRHPYLPRPAYKLPSDGASASNNNNPENTESQTTDSPSDASINRPETLTSGQNTLNDSPKATDNPTNSGFDNSWAPGDNGVQSAPDPIEDSTAPVNDKSVDTESAESDSNAPNLPTLSGIHGAPPNLRHNYPHRPNLWPKFYRRRQPGQYYNGQQNPYMTGQTHEFPTDGAPASKTKNPENVKPQTADSPTDNSNAQPNSGYRYSPTGFNNNLAPERDSTQSTSSPVEDSPIPVNDKPENTASPESDSHAPYLPTLHSIYGAPHHLYHKNPRKANDRPYYHGRHYPGQLYNGRRPYLPEHANKLLSDGAFAPNNNISENIQPQTTESSSDKLNDQPETTNNPLRPGKNNYEPADSPSNGGNSWAPAYASVQPTPSVKDSTAPMNDESKTNALPSFASDYNTPNQSTLHGIQKAPQNLHPKFLHRPNPFYKGRHYPAQFYNGKYPNFYRHGYKLPTDTASTPEKSQSQTTDLPSDNLNSHPNYGPADSTTSRGFNNDWAPAKDSTQSTSWSNQDNTTPITDEPKTTLNPSTVSINDKSTENPINAPNSNEDNVFDNPESDSDETINENGNGRSKIHRKFRKPQHRGRFYDTYKRKYHRKHPSAFPNDDLNTLKSNKPASKLPTLHGIHGAPPNFPNKNQNNPQLPVRNKLNYLHYKRQFPHRFRNLQHPHFGRFDNNSPGNSEDQTADSPSDSLNDQTNTKSHENYDPLNNPSNNNGFSSDDKTPVFDKSINDKYPQLNPITVPQDSDKNSNSDSPNSAINQHNIKNKYQRKNYMHHNYYPIRHGSIQTFNEDSTNVPTKNDDDQNNIDNDTTTTAYDDSVTASAYGDTSQEDSTGSKKKKKPLHFSSLISTWYNSEATRKPTTGSILNRYNTKDSDWQIEFGKKKHSLEKNQESSGDNSADVLSSGEKRKPYGSESETSIESKKSGYDSIFNDFGSSEDDSEIESLPTRALNVIVKIITSFEKILSENDEDVN